MVGRRLLGTALAVACSAAVTSCGDDPDRARVAPASPAAPRLVAPATTTTAPGPAGPSALDRDDAEAGVGPGARPVCELLPTSTVRRITRLATLTPTPQDSDGLSSCRYGRGDVNVRVLVDGSRGATRRFFNMQTEAIEFRAQGKGPPVTLVRGVGDDATYGNAGAYWFVSRKALTTFSERRIIRVIVALPGRTNAQLLSTAKRITRAALGALST